MKTAELIGPALDWAVAECEGGLDADIKVGKATSKAMVLDGPHGPVSMRTGEYFRPSTDWSQGGPIIEREKIELEHPDDEWRAWMHFQPEPCYEDGPTPLIAAMRCYVASRLGDEVEIPKELL